MWLRKKLLVLYFNIYISLIVLFPCNAPRTDHSYLTEALCNTYPLYLLDLIEEVGQRGRVV